MIQLKTPKGYCTMIRTQRGHRQVDCKICQNGSRSSRKTWQSQDQHPLQVTAKILQNHFVRTLFIQTYPKGSTTCLHTFPKIPNVRIASVRKLQGLLAEAIQNTARCCSVISLQPTTRSSMKKKRVRGMVWPLNGFKVTHAKQKTSQESIDLQWNTARRHLVGLRRKVLHRER